MGTHPIFESDFDCLTEIFEIKKMPSAEEMAASLEAGETHDDKFLAGHGGKNRTKAEAGQKQSAHADPSRKAVSTVVAGENARCHTLSSTSFSNLFLWFFVL